MKKVAIVNRTNLKNFGSVLQCFALSKAVDSLGYEADLVWERGTILRNYDFRPAKMIRTGTKLITHPYLMKDIMKSVRELRGKTISQQKVKLFDEFVEHNIRRKLFTHAELTAAVRNNVYDAYICGSDQVWCSTTTYVDPLMYLRFAPHGKRIAYAPSIGRDFIPPYNERIMRRYILDIPHVSIREKTGQRLIKSLTGRDVPVVLDPTLLLSQENWRTAEKAVHLPSQPFLLCYFLNAPHVDTVRAINALMTERGLKSVLVGDGFSGENVSLTGERPDCGPGEFLYCVDRADAVITDSYHGMLFSILFEKEFWSIEREYQQFDQSSRQLSILETLGLSDRYRKRGERLVGEQIDYHLVLAALDAEREKSVAYLRDALVDVEGT